MLAEGLEDRGFLRASVKAQALTQQLLTTDNAADDNNLLAAAENDEDALKGFRSNENL